MRRFGGLAVLAIFSLASVNPILSMSHRAPVLKLSSGSGDYHGVIKETDTVVSISPEIGVLDGTGPVCSYVITPHAGESATRQPVSSGAGRSGDKSRSSSAKDGEYDSEEDSEESEEAALTTETAASTSVPFHIDVEDQSNGRAVMRLKDGAVLDCSRSTYKFKIAARRCGDDEALSDSAIVEVHVDDTNNHDPEFTQSWYSAEVDEGRIYDHILKVEAKDADCGHPYGEICRYEITNNASPFRITQSGVLKNIKPLNYSFSHSHVVTVVAHDCGMRHSKPILVTIKVNPVCALELSNMNDQMEYVAEDRAKLLAPTVDLRLCDTDCMVDSIEGKISLHSLSLGRGGCDRERANAKMLQQICGADTSAVDLLPSAESVRLENQQNDNAVLSDLDTGVYVFDGEQNAVIVPPETTKPHIPDVFSLSFWMKHDQPMPRSGSKNHRAKENILCSSDDHRMNRHHFAIYLRNCKLELLIRRETINKKGENEFQPAEWRWHLPQVCDNQWHHYSMSMKFPQIELFVDGKLVTQTDDNTEILDDWPMHVAKDLKTKLVVGACWHGGSSKMAQFFKGYLAEMVYLPGRVERPEVLPCALQCKEHLDLENLRGLQAGEEAVLNNDMSELTLKAGNITEYVELLRQIAYVNRKAYPASGERSVTFATTINCQAPNTEERKSESIRLPNAKVNIDVKKGTDPVVTLEASQLEARSRSDVEQGVNIFPDLKLSARVGPTDAQARIDYCKIGTVPPLNKKREYFSSPAALISSMNLDFEQAQDGLLLKGAGSAKNYESILRQVHYFNSHPSDYNKRVFSLQCSILDGRIKSNELIVSMSIEAPVEHELKPILTDTEARTNVLSSSEPTSKVDIAVVTSTKAVASSGSEIKSEIETAAESSRTQQQQTSASERTTSENDLKLLVQDEPELRPHHLTVEKLAADAPRPNGAGPLPLLHPPNVGETYPGAGSAAGTGSAIAVVVVVCVGFLLLLIIVGILKIRSTHRRMLSKQRHHSVNGENGVGNGDLAWDDAGMNITVNPIEQVAATEVASHHDDDYSEISSEDEDGSYRDEDCSDEDEDECVLPHVASSANCHGGSVGSVNGVATTGLEWDDTTLHHPAVHNPRTRTYRV